MMEMNKYICKIYFFAFERAAMPLKGQNAKYCGFRLNCLEYFYILPQNIEAKSLLFLLKVLCSVVK